MKRNLAIATLGTLVTLVTAGCGEKSPAQNAAALERAFQARTPGSAANTPEASATASPSVPKPDPDVQQAVSLAAAAIRTNGYAQAFVTLRSVQASPHITFGKYTAIQNARLAVERDVASRAAAGDPAALRALEAIKASGHR